MTQLNGKLIVNILRTSRKYNTIHSTRHCLCHKFSNSYSTSAIADRLLSKNEVLKEKLNYAIRLYDDMIGMEEIRAAQNKVIEAQERFAAAQDKRREVNIELSDVSRKIKDIQEELSNTSKGNEKYIALITKEHKYMKEEISLSQKFNLYEREERELFSTLTSAVKYSHEKERIHANKTKYLSIIGSILGALIGIIGSNLNNRLKNEDLKKRIIEITEGQKQDVLIALQKEFEEMKKVEQALNEVVSKLKSEISSKSIIEEEEEKKEEGKSENEWYVLGLTGLSLYFLYRIFS